MNPTLCGRLPGYPNTAYGLGVTFEPTRQIYFSHAIFVGNNARGFQTGLYAEPHVNTYKFNIGEIGYEWRIGAQGKPGLVGVGMWGQTGRLLTPYLTYENGATGFYAFGNQRLWYQHPGGDTSGLIGFLQYGYTGDRPAKSMRISVVELTAVALAPADSMGIGVAWSRLNRGRFAGAFFFPGATSTALRTSEFMMQVYYQAVVYTSPGAKTAFGTIRDPQKPGSVHFGRPKKAVWYIFGGARPPKCTVLPAVTPPRRRPVAPDHVMIDPFRNQPPCLPDRGFRMMDPIECRARLERRHVVRSPHPQIPVRSHDSALASSCNLAEFTAHPGPTPFCE